MNFRFIDFCPICNSKLLYEHMEYDDVYYCNLNHYKLRTEHRHPQVMSDLITIQFNDFILSGTNDLTNAITNFHIYYKEKYVCYIPIPDFEWNNMDKLVNRLKTIIVFQ